MNRYPNIKEINSAADIYYNKYFNMGQHYLLFNNNINESIRDFTIHSIDFFINKLLPTGYHTNLKKLLESAKKYHNTFTSLLALGKYRFGNNEDKLKKNIYIPYHEAPVGFEYIMYHKKGKTKNITILKDFVEELIRYYMPLIKREYKDLTEGIIIGGYNEIYENEALAKYAEQKYPHHHSIVMYYKKQQNSNKYDIIISDSNENYTMSVNEYINIDKEKLYEMIVIFTLYKYRIIFSDGSRRFHESITKYLKYAHHVQNKITKDIFPNSYYSLYYIIKYYLEKYAKETFDPWYEFLTKNGAYSDIIQNINKHKYINSVDKNYLDLIKMAISSKKTDDISITEQIEKYKKDVTDCTNISTAIYGVEKTFDKNFVEKKMKDGKKFDIDKETDLETCLKKLVKYIKYYKDVKKNIIKVKMRTYYKTKIFHNLVQYKLEQIYWKEQLFSKISTIQRDSEYIKNIIKHLLDINILIHSGGIINKNDFMILMLLIKINELGKNLLIVKRNSKSQSDVNSNEAGLYDRYTFRSVYGKHYYLDKLSQYADVFYSRFNTRSMSIDKKSIHVVPYEDLYHLFYRNRNTVYANRDQFFDDIDANKYGIADLFSLTLRLNIFQLRYETRIKTYKAQKKIHFNMRLKSHPNQDSISTMYNCMYFKNFKYKEEKTGCQGIASFNFDNMIQILDLIKEHKLFKIQRIKNIVNVLRAQYSTAKRYYNSGYQAPYIKRVLRRMRRPYELSMFHDIDVSVEKNSRYLSEGKLISNPNVDYNIYTHIYNTNLRDYCKKYLTHHDINKTLSRKQLQNLPEWVQVYIIHIFIMIYQKEIIEKIKDNHDFKKYVKEKQLIKDSKYNISWKIIDTIMNQQFNLKMIKKVVIYYTTKKDSKKFDDKDTVSDYTDFNIVLCNFYIRLVLIFGFEDNITLFIKTLDETIIINKIETFTQHKVKNISINKNIIKTRFRNNDTMEFLLLSGYTFNNINILDEHFIFKKKKNKFIGYPIKGLKYKLYLEIQENSLEIYRIKNKNKHILVDHKKMTNELIKILSGMTNILVFEYNYTYEIDFIDYNIIFKMDSYKLEYKNYEVVTKPLNGLINNWVYNLPLAFILKDQKNSYKMLLFEINKLNFMPHIDTYWYRGPKALDEKLLSFNKNVYIIDIDYNGINLKFSDGYALSEYCAQCIMFQKEDSFYKIFNQCLNSKLVDLARFLFKERYFNSPYNTYYEYKMKLHQYQKLILPRNRDGNQEARVQILQKYENFMKNNEYLRKMKHYPKKYQLYKDNKKIEYEQQEYKIEFEFNIDKLFTITPQKNQLKTIINELSVDNQTKKELGEFIKIHQTCKINSSIDITKLKNIIENKNKNIISKQQEIFNKTVFSDNTLMDTIVQYRGKYYSLLLNIIEKKVLEDTINKLNEEKRECIELKRIYDFVNKDILYTGDRTLNIMLFEILFGAFIREEQYNIYKSIIDKIDAHRDGTTSYYQIYQLLMGRGKTSVIVPLITLYYLIHNNGLKNIILFTPDQLVKQTYDDLNEKYSQILFNSSLKALKNASRRNEIELLNYYKYFTEIPFTNNYKKDHINNKNIIIMNDKSIKTVLLNKLNIDNKANYNKLLENIRHKSVIIIDEFDDLYNPLKSDLNFQLDERSIKNSKLIHDKIYDFYVDFIDNLLKETKYKYKKLKHSTIKEKFNQYINTYDFGLTYNKYKSDILKLTKNKTAINLTKENYYFIKSMEKLLNILITSFNLIYLKDYGFPTSTSHNTQFISVPYSYVNNPITGSQFSDLDISLILTTITYLLSNFRKIDITTLIKKIKENRESLTNFLDDSLIYRIFRDYLKFLEIKVDELIYIDLEGNYIDDLTIKLNEKENLNEFKKFYLKNMIIPNMTYSTKFFNCSTIDIIGRTFAKYKCGFSGTVNIKLPYLNEKRLEGENDSQGYEYNFYNIKPIDADNGSIKTAIIGYMNNKSKIEYVKLDSEILDIIISKLKNVNVLIDTGAFLREYSAKEVIVKIMEKINKKYFIYINEDDTKKVLMKNSEPVNYKNEIYPTEEVFMYYDNKHIVGQDIKQPFTLYGLATINKFNKLTEVSQGIFRMRNLNYGHRVDFLINDELESKIKDRAQLFMHLQHKEDDYIENEMERKKLIQNIKYLRRKGNKKDEYLEEKLIEYIEYKKDTEYSIDKDYIEAKLKELDDNTSLISALVKKLINLNRSITKQSNNLDQEQERTKEKESEKEKETEKDLIKQLQIDQPVEDLDKKFFPGDASSTMRSVYFDGSMMNTGGQNLLQNDGISFSKYFSFTLHKELYFPELYGKIDINSSLSNKEKDKNTLNKLLKLRELLYENNYYYIKHLSTKKYLMISSIEYYILSDHIVREGTYKYSNIIIKNKQGEIVYPFKYHDDINEEKEILVQFLLGKRCNFQDYLRVLNYIKGNYNEYKKLFELLSSNYRVRFYNSILFEVFEKANYNFDIFTNRLKQMDLSDFLYILSKTRTNIEPDLKKILTIIRNHYIRKIKNHIFCLDQSEKTVKCYPKEKQRSGIKKICNKTTFEKINEQEHKIYRNDNNDINFFGLLDQEEIKMIKPQDEIYKCK